MLIPSLAKSTPKTALNKQSISCETAVGVIFISPSNTPLLAPLKQEKIKDGARTSTHIKAPVPPPVYLQYGKAIKQTTIVETKPNTSIILNETDFITETRAIFFLARYSLTSFETTTGTAPMQTELNGMNKLYAIAK